MDISIRAMTQADKPAIMQILRHTPEFKPAEVLVAEEVIDGYLGTPDHCGYFALVAELGSDIVGYICYGATPLTESTWDVYWMAVAPDRQGQGIGGILMETCVKNIREAGGKLAIIETSSIPEYERTRRFHYHHGFELIATIPDFYAPGDDMVLLQKRLR